MERLAQHYKPIDLLTDVLANLHKDKEMAALLVPKLKLGCKEFMRNKREEVGTAEAIKGGTLAKDKLTNIIA